jgi:hypothetical protein
MRRHNENSSVRLYLFNTSLIGWVMNLCWGSESEGVGKQALSAGLIPSQMYIGTLCTIMIAVIVWPIKKC